MRIFSTPKKTQTAFHAFHSCPRDHYLGLTFPPGLIPPPDTTPLLFLLFGFGCPDRGLFSLLLLFLAGGISVFKGGIATGDVALPAMPFVVGALGGTVTSAGGDFSFSFLPVVER